MNATMRSINLTTYIVAPILVGQILTFGSKIAGAIFIAVWNICSCVLEYFLLTHIYKRIPQLAHKNIIPLIVIDSPHSNEASHPGESPDHCAEPITPNLNNNNDLNFDDLSEVSLVTPTHSGSKLGDLKNNKVYPLFGEQEPNKSQSCCRKTVNGISTKITESWNGWKDYFAHPVHNAGIGLALLYMTVLGFDSITTG